MITDKATLLATCVDKLPEKEISFRPGINITIKALKGSDALRASSIDSLDDKLMFVIPRGLVEPNLNNREIMKIINFNSELAVDIFTAIMDLSNALGEAEAAETEDAKKN